MDLGVFLKVTLKEEWSTTFCEATDEGLDFPVANQVGVAVAFKGKFLGAMFTWIFEFMMQVHVPGHGTWSI